MDERVECDLEHANGIPGKPCLTETCLYWRVAGHLGVDEEVSGCAIKYFSLLDDGAEMAAWLLSVKRRVESDSCE